MLTQIVIRQEARRWAINLVDTDGALAHVHSRRHYPTATRALASVARLLRRGLRPAFRSALDSLVEAAVDEASATERGRRPAA